MILPHICGTLAERIECLTDNTGTKQAIFKIEQSSFRTPGTRHAVSRRLESKHARAFIFRTLGLLDPEDGNNCETFEASEALHPTAPPHVLEDLNLQEHWLVYLKCGFNEGHCLLVCNIVQMKPGGSSETSVHIYETTRRHISEDSDLTAMTTSCHNGYLFSE